MSAKSRNLLKTRAQRLGEVLSHNHLKSGQADSQQIVTGCTGAANGVAFDVAAGEVVLHQVLQTLAASTAVAVTAGASTAAGEFRKVLVAKKADNSIVQTVGDKAASQALAKLPAGDVTAIDLFWLEIPASFVPGTTAVTAGMIKPVAYNAV